MQGYFNPDEEKLNVKHSTVYNANFTADVSFENCSFEEEVEFKYSAFSAKISFAGSTFNDEAVLQIFKI